MKKIIILCMLSLALTEDMNAKAEQEATKLDQLLSSSNTIKFYNFDLGTIKQTYGAKLECEIKRVHTTNDVTYFLQIKKPGEYSDATANIAEDDLVDLMEGLLVLKQEVTEDKKTDSNYMENKYMTEDGLYLGYYVSDGKVGWYMKLEKYGSKSTAFIKKIDDLEDMFNKAKEKISELKS